MQNVAKINLILEHCTDCPYCRKPEGYAEHFCQHDLKTPGVGVGDGTTIPDFCPFVIQRLERVLKTIQDSGAGTIPKKFINQVERKQKDDPHEKFGADHSWRHIRRVSEIGMDFLEHCVAYGYSSTDTVLKEKLLLQIAAYMHDIGLADSARNHDVHSAALTEKYLANPKVDIDLRDAYTIVHAVANHSDGKEMDSIVDAALILADKLDVTADRIVRVTDKITAECLKIQATEFRLHGKLGKAEGAELRYTVDEGFNLEIFKEWPKAIVIPYRVATEYLGLKDFKFLINDEEVELKGII